MALSGVLLIVYLVLSPLLFHADSESTMLVGAEVNGPPASSPPVATTPAPPTVVPPKVIPPPTTLPSPSVTPPPKTLPSPSVTPPPKTLPSPSVTPPPKTLPSPSVTPPPKTLPPPTTTPLPPPKSTSPPSIDCGAKCTVRCKLSSRPNLCNRACGTCCIRCKCVPSGTAGHYEECPCYANQTTHGLQRKCP